MISDLLRLQLELRRIWLDVSDKPNADSLFFNDADLILAGLLLDAVDATSLVSLDPRLHERLQQVNSRSDLARKVDIQLVLDRCPADQTSIMLVPIQQIQSQAVVDALRRADRVIAVYGWDAGWSPAAWDPAGWPPSVSLRPAACLSPALWRSSIHIATTEPQAGWIGIALDRVASVLNDRDLDVCTLLEHIQKLEENLRSRATASVVKPPTRVEDSDERVKALERKIEELQRTIELMQHGLAFAHSELSKSIEGE